MYPVAYFTGFRQIHRTRRRSKEVNSPGTLLGFSSMEAEDRQSKQSGLHTSFFCRAYLPSMGIDFTVQIFSASVAGL